ncbi:MAG: SGNH/GDSL hydrolase family protein [Nocardioides sp.]
MPQRPWSSLVPAFAAALAATAVLAAPTSQAAQDSLAYVALGDSYSAASGVLPLDLTAPPNCVRSSRSYPHVIAGRVDATLVDVTCGAADTTHFAGKQYPNVPPQLDALSESTELVTMTIGGNDSSVFINTIQQCGTVGVLSLGRGNPCQDKYGSSFADTIRETTYPSLVNALAAVHTKAPNAEVAILGYPWIMPRSDGCFSKMPIAKGDVPYVRGIQRVLNDAVRRAASATGTTYVDLDEVSEGHDACRPIGVRWVEPVLQGTNPVIVHPNALGEREMADQAMRVLGLS